MIAFDEVINIKSKANAQLQTYVQQLKTNVLTAAYNLTRILGAH